MSRVIFCINTFDETELLIIVANYSSILNRAARHRIYFARDIYHQSWLLPGHQIGLILEHGKIRPKICIENQAKAVNRAY
jgi:hypothetical protein